MIHFQIEDGKPTACAACGDVDTLCAEVSVMLGFVYNAMCDMDEDAGRMFKETFLAGIADPRIWKRRQVPIPKVGAIFWKEE